MFHNSKKKTPRTMPIDQPSYRQTQAAGPPPSLCCCLPACLLCAAVRCCQSPFALRKRRRKLPMFGAYLLSRGVVVSCAPCVCVCAWHRLRDLVLTPPHTWHDIPPPRSSRVHVNVYYAQPIDLVAPAFRSHSPRPPDDLLLLPDECIPSPQSCVVCQWTRLARLTSDRPLPSFFPFTHTGSHTSFAGPGRRSSSKQQKGSQPRSVCRARARARTPNDPTHPSSQHQQEQGALIAAAAMAKAGDMSISELLYTVRACLRVYAFPHPHQSTPPSVEPPPRCAANPTPPTHPPTHRPTDHNLPGGGRGRGPLLPLGRRHQVRPRRVQAPQDPGPRPRAHPGEPGGQDGAHLGN